MRSLKTCPNGHRYYKTTDCPACPICENERGKENNPFAALSAPARRALENNGIGNLVQLSAYSEKQVSSFHGMGPASLPVLRSLLEEQGLSFKSR